MQKGNGSRASNRSRKLSFDLFDINHCLFVNILNERIILFDRIQFFELLHIPFKAREIVTLILRVVEQSQIFHIVLDGHLTHDVRENGFPLFDPTLMNLFFDDDVLGLFHFNLLNALLHF